MKCPVCETELESKGFVLEEDRAINRYHCNTCSIDYHKCCPQGEKPKWFAYIALGDFPKKVWEDFLLEERNYWGDPMPERYTLSVYGPSEEEKEEVKKWYEEHR